jgi:hypothetical protein
VSGEQGQKKRREREKWLRTNRGLVVGGAQVVHEALEEAGLAGVGGADDEDLEKVGRIGVVEVSVHRGEGGCVSSSDGERRGYQAAASA